MKRQCAQWADAPSLGDVSGSAAHNPSAASASRAISGEANALTALSPSRLALAVDKHVATVPAGASADIAKNEREHVER